jgi:hypothetical protein
VFSAFVVAGRGFLRQNSRCRAALPTTFGGDMDSEPNWISFTAGTVLCALSGLLMLVLIAQGAQYHNTPEIQSQALSADIPAALRLLR